MKKLILCSILISKTLSFEISDKVIYREMLKSKLEETEKVNVKYNNSFSVIITIKNGKFDYKINKKSDIEKFNNRIIKFLDKQKKITYPTLKNEETITTKATFKAKF